MADFNSTKTGAEIDNSVDQAAAALPKAGGTLTGDVTTSTAKSLNTTAQLSEDALPKSGGALTGSVTTQNAKDLDTVIDRADLGSVGKVSAGSILYASAVNQFFQAGDIPSFGATAAGLSAKGANGRGFVMVGDNLKINYIGYSAAGAEGNLLTLLHDGNTSGVTFGGTVDTTPVINRVQIAPTSGANPSSIAHEAASTATNNSCIFINPNGTVGTIQTSGTATAYNTSSDPRLKDFKDSPTDEEIDAKFAALFSTFEVFNWKNDPEGDLVWGHNAHACIDANLDMGSEGQGSRELALGEVYDTTPAVFEDQEQQVLYKTGETKGQPRFNSDGTPMMETVSVEVTPEIQHKVTPAGVDQSKAEPILLAKIEQLERRLAMLEGA